MPPSIASTYHDTKLIPPWRQPCETGNALGAAIDPVPIKTLQFMTKPQFAGGDKIWRNAIEF
jgi:hypothetical protein